MALRIAVAGADALSRAGLVAILGGRRELTVVADHGMEAVAGPEVDAVVTLWDGRLDEPVPPVVALLGDEDAVAAALAAGARGILPRDAPADRIAAALVAVSQGLLAIDEAFEAAVVSRRQPAEPLIEPLTPREREVLALLADGLANKAIAQRLGISESTVKFHVNAILGKLAVENRSEAIVQAARLGLVVL